MNNEIFDFFEQENYQGEIIHDDTVAIEVEKNYAMYQILGTRDNQQDCAQIAGKENSLLAVVCDGMGGLGGGELASTAAVRMLVEDYEREEITDIRNFLIQEVIKIDAMVYDLEDEKGKRLEAGTTLAAVLIDSEKLFYVSVGDSRIYLMRGEEMEQLTEDQNYGMSLARSLKKGQISEAEFKKEEKYAEALISYIGMGGLRVIGCSGEEDLYLLPGDKILICSDGLYKSLSQGEIAKSLLNCRRDNMEQSLKEIVDAAMEQSQKLGKKQDNTTCILIIQEEK